MTYSFRLRPIDTSDLFFHTIADAFLYENAVTKPNGATKRRDAVDNESLVWSYDLPGVKASDLTVSVNGDSIHVEGTRQIFGNDSSRALKKSRVSKTFKVDPHTIDLTQLKANLSNGVLVLSTPKKTKPKPRLVEVTTEAEPTPVTALNDETEVSESTSGDQLVHAHHDVDSEGKKTADGEKIEQDVTLADFI